MHRPTVTDTTDHQIHRRDLIVAAFARARLFSPTRDLFDGSEARVVYDDVEAHARCLVSGAGGVWTIPTVDVLDQMAHGLIQLARQEWAIPADQLLNLLRTLSPLLDEDDALP